MVEAIAKKSQNIKWETTVDKKKVGHKLIRRVSLDKFYEIVTGDREAFYKICMKLPKIIEEIIKEEGNNLIPKDIVFEELENLVKKEKITFEMAIYLLGFRSYEGF